MKKYALITGASGGIGFAIAKKLAFEGYSLYLQYHRGTKQMKELCEALSSYEVIPIQADLSKKDGSKQLWDQIQHDIDAVVYAAGKSVFGLVTDVEEKVIEEMTCLSVTTMYKLMNYALPTMIRKRSGSIVVISSIWGQTGASCEVLYSMLKGAQNTYVKALAKELAPSFVRVNAVAPGAVETTMMNMFSDKEKQDIAEEIPMGRLGNPEEIANVTAFLLSDSSSYITGQIIGVNGGWYC
ncbi:elongation factor P 5-aminopentanone reductase [Ectobacillus sp. sgz5001026]|uniref:elongation factor P 5-aminopentanone reductase n=1 Tax=Ectobacillus sp. sgz5001026 TaxID=3242473 RepID=UPI0036D33FD5